MHYLPILGISVSSLLLLLIQNVYIYQPFDSYIYTIPVITFCVAKILFLKPKLKFQEWGGLLCMVPAFGYMASKYAIGIHDLAYLSWQQGVAHLLRIFYVSTEGVYLIFGCCALCAWSIGSRFISFYFLWVSLLQGMVYYLLYISVVELDHGSPHAANLKLLFAEGIRLFTLLPIVLFINSSLKLEKYNQIYPMFFSCVISFLFVCPPLAFQMYKLDTAIPSEEPPQGVAMYGGALQSADPKSSDFLQQLNHQGTIRHRKLNWWCNTQYRQDWDTKTRATATLAMNRDDRFSDLAPFIEEFFYRGVTRLAFVGKSHEEISFGPLRKHIQFPLARFFLDPVPEHAFWGIADNEEGVRWIEKEPVKLIENGVTPCGIWVDDEISIQTLFTISQTYGEPTGICSYGLFLVFGTPLEGQETTWKSPIQCQF